MVLSPMRLLRIPEPFDHPDFLFEPKLDGFRALAHIDRHRCSVISRNGNVFKSWPQLCEELAGRFGAEAPCLMAKSAALIRTAAPTSRACFSGASNRHFYAFDLLMLNGRDLRGLPLTDMSPSDKTSGGGPEYRRPGAHPYDSASFGAKSAGLEQTG